MLSRCIMCKTVRFNWSMHMPNRSMQCRTQFRGKNNVIHHLLTHSSNHHQSSHNLVVVGSQMATRWVGMETTRITRITQLQADSVEVVVEIQMEDLPDNPQALHMVVEVEVEEDSLPDSPQALHMVVEVQAEEDSLVNQEDPLVHRVDPQDHPEEDQDLKDLQDLKDRQVDRVDPHPDGIGVWDPLALQDLVDPLDPDLGGSMDPTVGLTRFSQESSVDITHLPNVF